MSTIGFNASPTSPFESEYKDKISKNFVFGDFNNDGILDKGVLQGRINQETKQFSIFQGDKQGNFTKIKGSTFKTKDSGFTPGDFNGDGNLDLASFTQLDLNSQTVNISFLLGDGTGKFNSYPQLIKIPLIDGMLYVQDLNNDGLNDILLKGLGRTDVYLRNQDNTQFVAAPNSPFKPSSDNEFLAIADFNNDGWLDKAVIKGNYGSPKPETLITIYAGDEEGNFKRIKDATIKLETTGVYFNNFTVGYFDNNEYLDIGLKTYTNNSDDSGFRQKLTLLLGDGKGYFQVEKSKIEAGNFTLDRWSYISNFGDFNNDGLTDIELNRYSRLYDVGVLLGNKKGKFEPTSNFKVEYADRAAVGDINSDGNPDLLVTQGLKQSLQVFLGNGKGDFAPASEINLKDNYLNRLNLIDVNSDRHLDIIVEWDETDQETLDVYNKTSVLLGDGKGKFSSPSSPIQVESGKEQAIGDFNSDGLLDLVVTKNSYPYNKRTSELSVFLGQKKDKFVELNKFKVDNLQLLSQGDFNNDGKLDLLVFKKVPGTDAAFDRYSMEVMEGDGKGNFSPIKKGAIELPDDSRPGNIQVADLNGDGNLDVAVQRLINRRKVDILLGDGQGKFTLDIDSAVTLPKSFKYNNFLSIADFNGDRELDIAGVDFTKATTKSSFAILLNDFNIAPGKDKLETVDNLSGTDVLTDDKGSDRFIFNNIPPVGKEDIITDFGRGDKIVLDLDTFDRLDPNVDFAEQFAVVKSDRDIASKDAVLIYNENNGNLFYNPNGSIGGFGGGGLLANLADSPELDAKDFILRS